MSTFAVLQPAELRQLDASIVFVQVKSLRETEAVGTFTIFLALRKVGAFLEKCFVCLGQMLCDLLQGFGYLPTTMPAAKIETASTTAGGAFSMKETERADQSRFLT